MTLPHSFNSDYSKIHQHTVDPMNITNSVPIALKTAMEDIGVTRKSDMVLNITIETASLMTDSP